MTTVHILCATYNGARFLPQFLDSLEGQTHEDWRLWLRDDASSDGTRELLRAAADRHPRICLLDGGCERLGSTGSFGWLLRHAPADAAYLMFADQDDVWLPYKIERTLQAMTVAEESSPQSPPPVLVHTDMTVVDANLKVVHPSFRRMAGFPSRVSSLRRLIAGNVMAGAAAMLNRPLCELVGTIPAEAVQHDWWCACVAVAFGRFVAVPESTVLYRQHGENAVGAYDARVSLRDLHRVVRAGLERTPEFRLGLRQTAAQAKAFLDRYGDRLGRDDRAFLSAYARLPEQRFFQRKLDLLRYRALPDQGILRALSVLIRG